ncbi:MAG: hypothetical protein JJV98_12540, partial [Desulfosarcina sp.]|nr:hypothetical protein [Desulfobacterales bacterium]
LPMTDVAHHLARIYGLDIETVLSAGTESEKAPPSLEPDRIEMTGCLPKPSPPRITLDPASNPVEVDNLKPQGSPYAF